MAGNATDEFLRHYGIPGMKWGRRKSRPSYEKSVRTFGGDAPHRNLNASPKSIDAQKARNSQARVKAAGTDALTTKELKQLVERQNLERQYAQLNPKPVSLGSKIVGDLMPAIGSTFMAQRALHRPQQAPMSETPMSTALALPRSKKQMMADIVLATGKQVIAEKGLDIGIAIAKSLIK